MQKVAEAHQCATCAGVHDKTELDFNDVRKMLSDNIGSTPERLGTLYVLIVDMRATSREARADLDVHIQAFPLGKSRVLRTFFSVATREHQGYDLLWWRDAIEPQRLSMKILNHSVARKYFDCRDREDRNILNSQEALPSMTRLRPRRRGGAIILAAIARFSRCPVTTSILGWTLWAKRLARSGLTSPPFKTTAVCTWARPQRFNNGAQGVQGAVARFGAS